MSQVKNLIRPAAKLMSAHVKDEFLICFEWGVFLIDFGSKMGSKFTVIPELVIEMGYKAKILRTNIFCPVFLKVLKTLTICHHIENDVITLCFFHFCRKRLFSYIVNLKQTFLNTNLFTYLTNLKPF